MKHSFESPINATEENSPERRNRRCDETILILGQLANNHQEVFENPKLFRGIKTDDIDAVENKDLEKFTKRIQEGHILPIPNLQQTIILIDWNYTMIPMTCMMMIMVIIKEFEKI